MILLIGIVKKNAIMMIDFALDGERERGLSTRDAIFEACLRALPADHDDDDGGAAGRAAARARRPATAPRCGGRSGIAIVGGLVLSASC